MSVRLRFAAFELDVAAPRLTRAGEPVALDAKALEALLLLVAQPGAVVSKDALYRTLWPNVFVRDRALARVARSLRAALDDNPAAPRFVETVPRRGYRFIAPVERLDGE